MKFLSFTLVFWVTSAAWLYPSKAVAVPSVQDVQKAALRYAHIQPEHLLELKKKIHASAWLPQLQFDYYRRDNSDIDIDVTDNVYVSSGGVVVGPAENTQSEQSFNDERFGVRAVWNLDRLIYAQDDLRLSVETRNLMQARRELLAEINKLYFYRERLLALKRTGLELQEVNAGLDALTGGWFSQSLAGEK